MTSLNTQLTISLQGPSIDNTINVSYKPSEFQAGSYGFYGNCNNYGTYSTYDNFVNRVKSLDSILNLGTKSCVLYETLSRLNTLLTSYVNVYDRLFLRGHSTIKTELIDKRLGISKLLSLVPYQKMNQIITLLINSFVKEPDFYDFSLGMLDVASNKIKMELDGDFTKIKRRINENWIASVIIESVDGYSSQSKQSSFSFRDNYKFLIRSEGGIEQVTCSISKMFSSSIKPYTDIYMEKIVNDSFKAILTRCEVSQGIHSQLESLAWELYTTDGNKRHWNSDLDSVSVSDSDSIPDSVSALYAEFDELVTMFFKKFAETSFYCSPAIGGVKRQVTAGISAGISAGSTSGSVSKFDYRDFTTYHNTRQHNYLELKKKGLPVPSSMTESEISISISRTKRYFLVFGLCEASITSVLEHSFDSFSSIVLALESSINKLVDAVSLLYNEDSELIL
jgi:hypothetical protein